MTVPVVLITAGSAGLGAATARVFAHNGYRVIINYSNNAVRAETLVGELNAGSASSSAKHMAIRADLSVRKDVEQLVQDAHAAYGRLDVIFSNGGWTEFRDTTKLSDNAFDEDWDRAFVMNVKSHMWLLHAAEAFLTAQEGAFITTASLAGVKGMGSSLVSESTCVHQEYLLTPPPGVCCCQGRPDPHGPRHGEHGGTQGARKLGRAGAARDRVGRTVLCRAEKGLPRKDETKAFRNRPGTYNVHAYKNGVLTNSSGRRRAGFGSGKEQEHDGCQHHHGWRLVLVK